MKKILLMVVLAVAACGGTEGDVGRKGGYITTDGRGVNPRCCGASTNVDSGVNTTSSTTTCSTCHTTGAGN